MRRRSVRLWLISTVLFAAVFASRLALDMQNQIAYSYPYAVSIQFYGYGLALLTLLIGIVTQAQSGADRAQGFLVWIVLAFASCAAILSSIPK